MNKHLQERVEQHLTRYDTALLATCGPAGPQITPVTYQAQHLDLYLYVPHITDHVFNLETQPDVVLLTPGWKLHGRMIPAGDMIAPHEWENVVRVQLNRFHILSEDSKTIIETIDV